MGLLDMETANQKNTISELKILSRDDDESEQRDNNSADPNLMAPQTAGMTSGVSGEVDKGMVQNSFPYGFREISV